MTVAEPELRAHVVRVCERLWRRGLVAGQDGNVSARLGPGRLLITPAGFSKVDVSVDDLVVVDGAGRLLDGGHQPSSEMGLHLAAYARRPDVTAVVHAHPPTATALGLVGETLPPRVLAEIIVLLGPVPLVPFGMPGTADVAERFEPFWAGNDTFLMANHGALTVGASLTVAHQRMESLEHAARIVVTARAMGQLHEIGPEDVRMLEQLRNVLRTPAAGAQAPRGTGREE